MKFGKLGTVAPGALTSSSADTNPLIRIRSPASPDLARAPTRSNPFFLHRPGGSGVNDPQLVRQLVARASRSGNENNPDRDGLATKRSGSETTAQAAKPPL